jgi:hypothetical protein
MKYVYVLASNDTDLFYEQFYLSVSSFRLHNPASEIVLLLDKKTKEGLTGKRSGYENLVSNTVVISPPDFLTKKEVSRFIKTSMRRYVTGDFLYIDCDTVIAENLDFNFPSDIKIGAVPDCHIPLKKHHYYRQFRDENLRLGFNSILEYDLYYNGGIIFCGDTPEAYRFFEKWHSLWNETREKGNSQDMPSFNRANYELNNIITSIDGEWNCQISNNGLPFLYQAKIIHYFATSLMFVSSPFIPASETVLSSIKENGKISDVIYQKLKNPKSAFEPRSRIIADADVLGIYDSTLFTVLRRLRKRNRKLFNVFEVTAYRFLSLFKK